MHVEAAKSRSFSVYTGRYHVVSPPQPLVEPLDFSLGQIVLSPRATIYAPSLEERW